MYMYSYNHDDVITTPLWGESFGDRRIPFTKGQYCGVLMVSLLLALISCCTNNPEIRDALTPLLWCHVYSVHSLVSDSCFNLVLLWIRSVTWMPPFLYKGKLLVANTHIKVHFADTWYGLHRKGLNSSPHCSTYMRQWIVSALVQIMAWHWIGDKPLSEPMLTRFTEPVLGYCQLET